MTTAELKQNIENQFREMYYQHWKKYGDDSDTVWFFYDHHIPELTDTEWVAELYDKYEENLSVIFEDMGDDFETEYYDFIIREIKRHKHDVCMLTIEYMNDITGAR